MALFKNEFAIFFMYQYKYRIWFLGKAKQY